MLKTIKESNYLTIANHNGLEATFSSIGAGVKSLSLNGRPLILELSNPIEYLNSQQYFGKTLGRVAGRIPYDIKAGGLTLNLPHDRDGICLHGGTRESLSFRNFKGNVRSLENGSRVSFHYLSPDNEASFPGNLYVKVSYSLIRGASEKENFFVINYDCTTDKDTPVSLSNHMYFNIFNTKDVNDYKLSVKASEVGHFKGDTQLVDSKEPIPDYLDFRNKPSLSEKLDAIKTNCKQTKTLDHTYYFDEVNTDIPQVVLDTDHVTIEVYTDFDACNLYVDSSMSDVEFTNGKDLMARRAIAIEPQESLLKDFILRPNSKYSHFIKYRILTK